MRFHRKLSAEVKAMLHWQLQEYEREVPMSENERAQLRAWVASGHSPYDNDWSLCDEYYCPLDYITASRIICDEKIMSNAIYDYDTVADEPIIRIVMDDAADNPTEELPF